MRAAAQFLHPRNTLSYVSVLAGLAAVYAALTSGSWAGAGGMLALSALADTFDGKFARRFDASPVQQRFGVQFDSLADAVVFGLVPVVCLALLLPFDSAGTRSLWWAAASFYLIAAITRLAAYNLDAESRKGFIGLPTTVAGLIWSSLFLRPPSAVVSIVVLIACGVAMVSYIPIRRPRGWGMAAFVAWPVALILLHVLASLRMLLR